jgi:curved DNA-binding protein
MSRDLYETLGVPRDADEDTIKKAFRKLAMKYHPDKSPGKANEQRFKEVNHANEILSDKDKRSLYDEFGEESLAAGFDAERARAFRQYQRRGSGGGPGRAAGFEDMFGRGGGGGGNPDLGDLIGDLFGRAGVAGGGRPGGARPQQPQRGQDLEATVTIDFVSAVKGTTISIQRGADAVSVRVPAGADEGSRLRIQNKGGEGVAGGPAGDLLLVVHVTPHPHFRREGDDLFVDVPLTIGEAYHGLKVRVPTPEGEVTLKVPARTQSGQITRLRGKGVARKGKEAGDLYAKFLVQYPNLEDPEVAGAVDVLERRMTDPRTLLKF